jgi:hypothetical protein
LSVLSEHFLPKELYQIFAPIPGGGHATLRGAVVQALLVEEEEAFAPHIVTVSVGSTVILVAQ